eukprot:GHVR01084491.1.p1 GENE.GHVR01084491.1~~GHVR01084491.1.p1  ORF type:complete len:144 (+),score=52.85 GHVR01084491.1:414-845(+)
MQMDVRLSDESQIQKHTLFDRCLQRELKDGRPTSKKELNFECYARFTCGREYLDMSRCAVNATRNTSGGGSSGGSSGGSVACSDGKSYINNNDINNNNNNINNNINNSNEQIDYTHCKAQVNEFCSCVRRKFSNFLLESSMEL